MGGNMNQAKAAGAALGNTVANFSNSPFDIRLAAVCASFAMVKLNGGFTPKGN
jgi:hypothetical protein